MTAPILPLRVKDLAYEIGGKRLIDGISFELAAGPRSVVLGPNGAGKSLTLRLCHGLITPSAGTVEWTGAHAHAEQAMVFQRPVMLRRTVAANLSYALAARDVKSRDRRTRVNEALERTGLGHLARVPARVLSVGEQQRLALARAWVLEPQVLFLDEPTANLDPASTRAVEALVTGMHERGVKIILTTQDLGQARRLADEILFLHQGHLLERAPAEEFFTRPATAEARAFIAGDLIPEASVA